MTKAIPLKARAEKALTISFPLSTRGSSIAPGMCSVTNQIKIMTPSRIDTGFNQILRIIAEPAAINATPAK